MDWFSYTDILSTLNISSTAICNLFYRLFFFQLLWLDKNRCQKSTFFFVTVCTLMQSNESALLLKTRQISPFE